MTYEPLHHKYRPQTFGDLVGQEAITTTLSNAMRLRRIAPAYLFTGPRGTGKTSSARILSKSLNCLSSPVPTPEPCGVCDACQSITRGGALDVIEIDAASNTGVDNIRELIERAQFAPVQCRYKIYCLDEVHMLSTAAFNALLKTLEEPPDRVVFILATTDPQRVLPTIISRCQRFDFRRIPLQAMIQHLTMIAQAENVAIAPTAVELVAQIAQGGLRDAESLLDQLSLLTGEITVDRVWDLVGSVPEQDLMALSKAIATANPEIILERTRHLLDRGREPLIVLQNLTGFYRDLLIAKTAPNRRDLVAVTEPTWNTLIEFAKELDLSAILAGQQHLRTCEIQVKNTTQPRLWLEVALLGLISLPSTINPSPQPQAAVVPTRSAPTLPVPVPTSQSSNAYAANASPVTPSETHPAIAEPVFSAESPSPSTARPRVVPVTPSGSLDQNDAPWPSAPLASAPIEETGLQGQPIPQAQPIPAEIPPAPAIAKEAIAPAFPAQSEATTFPTASPVQSAESIELDLAQLWKQVLGQLNRPTQALLSEHGQLLSFRGREAQIGIRNASLARLAQNKLPDVEAGFFKVFNRKVGVSLQIMTAQSHPPSAASTPSASTRPGSTHAPTQPPAHLPTPSPANGSAHGAANGLNHAEPSLSSVPQAIASPVLAAQTLPHSDTGSTSGSTFGTVPQPPQSPQSYPSSNGTAAALPTAVLPTAPPSWETYDELTHSARNFAQFFNGALVNLDGSEPEGGEPLSEILPAAEILTSESIDGPEWEDSEEK